MPGLGYPGSFTHVVGSVHGAQPGFSAVALRIFFIAWPLLKLACLEEAFISRGSFPREKAPMSKHLETVCLLMLAHILLAKANCMAWSRVSERGTSASAELPGGTVIGGRPCPGLPQAA